MNRTLSTVKNSIYGVATQMLNSILTFICRTVFIHTLGSTYLGVGGLFSNILSVLSLAELGIGSAMTYNLYKPLATNDYYSVSKYMNLYGKAYKIIGFFITVIGFSLIPFLKYIIKDINAVPNIYVIYMLYIVNAGISYFMSYKRTLFEADQKNYVVLIVQTIMNVVMNVLQMIVLVIFHNYIIYFSISILTSFLTNLIISYWGTKEYKYLSDYKDAKLDSSEKKQLVKHIGAMMSHKVGSVVVNSTDNIIISSVLGLSTVGIYSNYITIINMVKSFTNPILSSFTASVGNLNASSGVEKSYSIFKTIYLFEYFLHGLISICFFVLFPPFIKLWIGEKYLVDTLVLLVIVANYYLSSMRHVVTTYNTTLGLFWNDRFKPWLEAGINLVASLLLVQYMGLAGVFVGTLLSTILVCWWIEPYLLYKHYFKKNVFSYLGKYLIDIMFLCLCGILINGIITLVDNFILKLFICVSLTILLYLFRFFRTKEFKYIIASINVVLNRLIKK